VPASSRSVSRCPCCLTLRQVGGVRWRFPEVRESAELDRHSGRQLALKPLAAPAVDGACGEALSLAWLLARILGHRLAQVERSGNDAVLLLGVGDRVSLA
jgi:hypothetical protein